MKIVFTGGGTGGHFYPIIAITQKVNQIISHEHILGAQLFYISDGPYDKKILVENNLLYEQISAGKMRTYFSLKNFSSKGKTTKTFLKSFLILFTLPIPQAQTWGVI